MGKDCYTWSCPSLYKITLSKLFNVLKRFDNPIHFKLSDNHLISIVTEANRHPGEYVLSLSVSNSDWAQMPFEIDEDELAKIDEDFDRADIVGSYSQKKEAVRSKRASYLNNIITAIEKLGSRTGSSVKSCKKEVKTNADKIAAINMTVANGEYKTYPLTVREKLEIAESFYSGNKKKKRCFSVLK